jgi:hypothetical protein
MSAAEPASAVALVGAHFRTNNATKRQELEMENTKADHAKHQRARRAAQRAGFVARKSRRYSPPNEFGGYMIIDPASNFPVNGFQYELTADDVLTLCNTD